MLLDMALSGCGRGLKLIHFGGGHEHLRVLQRLPSKSGNLSSAVPLVFQQSDSQRYTADVLGAHLRQSPFRMAPC